MSNNNLTVETVDKVVVRVIKNTSYISGVCLIGIMLVAFFNVIGEKLRALGLPFTCCFSSRCPCNFRSRTYPY